MVATLMLAGAKPALPVPVIPLTAVVRSPRNPDGYAVFIVEDQSGKTLARVRDVELGEAYGNKIGVRAGLSPGERVITRGSNLIKDGWQVQIISGTE
jgi:multidrug efflux system membrane fusion protein